jgi:hypothetical protein
MRDGTTAVTESVTDSVPTTSVLCTDPAETSTVTAFVSATPTFSTALSAARGDRPRKRVYFSGQDADPYCRILQRWSSTPVLKKTPVISSGAHPGGGTGQFAGHLIFAKATGSK